MTYVSWHIDMSKKKFKKLKKERGTVKRKDKELKK